MVVPTVQRSADPASDPGLDDLLFEVDEGWLENEPTLPSSRRVLPMRQGCLIRAFKPNRRSTALTIFQATR